ncbi:MAG TPA: CehA/McbA family metallohydrolase [Polyangia bacterium]
MRSRAALVLALAAAEAGCELPPGAPDGALTLTPRNFDGGTIDLAGADLTLPTLPGNLLPLDGGVGAPPLARLIFTITDGDDGQPVPSRVIFRPPPHAGFADSITSGRYDPLSWGGNTGAVVGPGVLGSPEGVLLAYGTGEVPVPAGTYSLFITRGPEYEAVETSVTVSAGEVRPISAELERSVDTRGWLAADMHVHTSRSFDSWMRGDRRVISMVTGGVEVIVPTDHNVSTDLAPAIRALGYGPDRVGTVTGNEFNFKEGHAGVYPVAPPPVFRQEGMPPGPPDCSMGSTAIYCTTAALAFPRMHAELPGVTVVTVNHPFWPEGDLGYFTNIQWGAGTAHPLPALLPTAGLFDAMEVLNGYQTRATVENNLVADWFFLLEHGHRITALGNSDTHRINWVRGGWPRTWLRLPNDRPGDTTGAGLSEAIKHNRAIASTGPFVIFTADGAQIGDTVVPLRPGVVSLDITADAPAWIDLDRVRVYVDGELRQDFQVSRGLRPVFHTRFDEKIAGDGFIVVFASGSRPLPPDVVGELSHTIGREMLPWAITNPIFVDGDGDGVWSPPRPAVRHLTRPPAPLAAREELSVPVGCGPDDPTPLETPEQLLLPLLDP